MIEMTTIINIVTHSQKVGLGDVGDIFHYIIFLRLVEFWNMQFIMKT